MKIYILTENCASPHFKAEHGLSYFIENDNENVLFDFGASDIFIQNSKLLNIDIDSVKKIVLSHGHWDHGNGLEHLRNKKLICHPEAFSKRFRKNSKEEVGLKLSREKLQQNLEIVTSQVPHKVTDNITFLGEIPRLNNFEAQETPYINTSENPDYIYDDSALAITDKGVLTIVTGCSHSGICNICEYAKKVTGINKIKTVIGGFHLKKQNKQTKETIEYFKKHDGIKLYPSHCTQLPALVAFYNEFKIEHLKSGMILEI